jgi:hypothetical protein
MNQLAKAIADIATGEQKDATPKRGRAGGVRGAAARAAKLTPEQRQEIARKAAAKRWSG